MNTTPAKAATPRRRLLFASLIVALSLVLGACGSGNPPDPGGPETCVFGTSTFGNCTFGP